MRSIRPCAAGLALAAWLHGAPCDRVAAQDTLPGPGSAEAAQPAADPFGKRLSYALGINIGRDLRENQAPVNMQALVAGLSDALAGSQPQMSDAECQQVLEFFQQQVQQKEQARMAAAADQNKDKGEAFLAANAKKDGITVTASGLQYRILEEGSGASPGPGDTVRCHYEGTLIDGSVFDSSYRRGEPAEFPVGGVIAGWTEALQLMEPGAKWEVFLPSDIAYGPRGAGGAIGPNETLIFTIELLDVVN